MTRILRMADGTEVEISRCGEADGHLWIVAGADRETCQAIFGDPEKTKVMVDTYREDSGIRHVVWEGYTRLVALRDDGGRTKADMTKER